MNEPKAKAEESFIWLDFFGSFFYPRKK